jgi:hypothetical protein
MRALHRSLACALIVVATASISARETRPPEQITIGERESLRLWGWAQRTHLLGAVDLYTVAVYSPAGSDYARLAAIDAPKALRIEVTHQDDLRRRVPLDWQRELVPRLDPQPIAHLRGVFAPLRTGDVVQIEYLPQKGTTVRVNRDIAMSGAHHDLMLAFLDHWLGQRPVSDEIRRTLLGVT